MGNLRRSSRIDFEKIFLLLFLNVCNRFNPLRGLVAVTAIGVRYLNYASMTDRDRSNVLGVRRYERFAFMDSIIVLHVLLRVFFLGHLYTNNHNYIITRIYTPTNTNNISSIKLLQTISQTSEMYYVNQIASCKLSGVKSKIIT